jgi:antitoxin PrlF
MSWYITDETTVDDSYCVTVPVSIRKHAGIEPEDTLRWTVDEEGQLSVEIVHNSAFSELEPVDIGEDTNVAENHDLAIINSERTDDGSD